MMLRLSRIAAISAMLAVSSVGTAVAFSAGTASASAPSVTCTGFNAKGNTAKTSATGTVSGCTAAITGGGGKVTTSLNYAKGTGTAVITWTKGGTTKSSYTFKLNPKGAPAHCAAGLLLVAESSVTTGGTNKKIPVGQKSSDYLCAKASTGNTTLAPGQKYTI
jgi:hypothetical protein